MNILSTNKSVAIAIVFGGGDDDGNSYEYVIRPNATNFNSEEKQAQPAAKTTPSTERVFDPYKREDGNSCSSSGGSPGPGSCTKQYMLNGGSLFHIRFDQVLVFFFVTHPLYFFSYHYPETCG